MEEKATLDYEIEYKVLNPDGTIVKEGIIKPHTANLNFSELLVSLFPKGDATVTSNFIDTGNNSRVAYSPMSSYNIHYYSLDAARKAQCYLGTSNAALNRNHYNLQTYLASVDYSTYEVEDAVDYYWTKFAFSWQNTTGVSKTIEELGFVPCINFYGTAGIVRVMITRDLTGGIVVANLQVLAINYRFKMP